MQILLHLGKKGSQCSQIPTIGLQGLAITLHTKLRKQGFNPHCHIQIWYPPKPLHGMQSEIKVASVLLVGYISISCILTLWNQMFPAFSTDLPCYFSCYRNRSSQQLPAFLQLSDSHSQALRYMRRIFKFAD